jgi:hypothetical protein
MRLSNLKRASDYDVEKWLTEELNLTPYQKEKMRDRELIRFTPFDFYEDKQKEKISPLWRITIFFFPIYLILLYIGLPFTMLFTGKWGYGRNFIDNFHNVWTYKLKL